MGVSVVQEKTDEASAFGADIEKAPAMKASVTTEAINLAVNLQSTLPSSPMAPAAPLEAPGMDVSTVQFPE
jgi:hypothetical protein